MTATVEVTSATARSNGKWSSLFSVFLHCYPIFLLFASLAFCYIHISWQNFDSLFILSFVLAAFSGFTFFSFLSSFPGFFFSRFAAFLVLNYRLPSSRSFSYSASSTEFPFPDQIKFTMVFCLLGFGVAKFFYVNLRIFLCFNLAINWLYYVYIRFLKSISYSCTCMYIIICYISGFDILYWQYGE